MAGSTPAKLAKFGCSNFEYGVVGDGDLVQTTRKVPGLSEVKIELTDEMKTLAADDGPYVVLSGGITETKETINIYDLDSETKKDLYGITVEKGVEKYAKNIMPNYVATLFKTKLSNGKNVWFALLKGMFSLPGISSKTQDGTPDPEADEIEGSFVPRGDADTGNILLIGREDSTDFNFETFHAMVFPKTADEATGNTASTANP